METLSKNDWSFLFNLYNNSFWGPGDTISSTLKTAAHSLEIKSYQIKSGPTKDIEIKSNLLNKYVLIQFKLNQSSWTISPNHIKFNHQPINNFPIKSVPIKLGCNRSSIKSNWNLKKIKVNYINAHCNIFFFFKHFQKSYR